MRSPSRILGFLASATFVACAAIACGGEGTTEPGTGTDDIKQATEPNAAVKKLVDSSECAAANGGHELSVYKVAEFDAAKVMAEMKAADRERGCPGRVYSVSRETGAKAFTDWMDEQKDPIDEQCVDEEKASELRPKLAELVRDPKNIGVFSSLHDEKKSDDPVSCFYFRYWVYRADGTLVKFDFDWSD